MPHPDGTITVSYKINKKGELTASITIPENTAGVFCWKGKEYPLKGGIFQLRVES